MLQNIRIMLVETSHTGSMGSIVRAMKTIGLTSLWLVNPLAKPDSQAIALAAGANNAIGSTHIVDTSGEALAGCNLVMGTSACSRTLSWPMLDPCECGLKSVAKAANTPVALAFGRERVGPANEELQKYHYHVAIAVNPEYSSLSLAMAVQVIAYKVRMAWPTTQENGEQVEREETPCPLVGDLRCSYGHLEQTLLAAGSIRGNHPGQMMNKSCRLSTCACPGSQELNTLRGILASIEQQSRGNKAE